MSQDQEKAFPQLETFQKFDDDAGRYVDHTLPTGGMTLRDYFAARIACRFFCLSDPPEIYNDAAKRAYRMADALLEARKSRP